MIDIPIPILLLRHLEKKEYAPTFFETAQGMAQLLNISVPASYRWVWKLEKEGFIETTGERIEGKTHHYTMRNGKLKAYRITPMGLEELKRIRKELG